MSSIVIVSLVGVVAFAVGYAVGYRQGVRRAPVHPQEAESVKVSPLVVLLIGLAIGGFAFGSCQASRASDAEKSLQNALAAHRDSLAQWHIERSALSLA